MSLLFKYRTIINCEMRRMKESYMTQEEYKEVCRELYRITSNDILKLCDHLCETVYKLEHDNSIHQKTREKKIKEAANICQFQCESIWTHYHERLDKITDDFQNGIVVVDYIRSPNLSNTIFV